MPRSYRDWVRAQKTFAANYYSALAEIGDPDETYIIYERKSNNPYWESKRQEAENLLSKIPINPPTDPFEFIGEMGEKEKQKEIRFLQTFGNKIIDSNCSDYELVETFNELFQSKDRYKRLLDRIKKVQTTTTKKNERIKAMAPNLESLYGSYLESHLVRVFAATNFQTKTNEQIDKLVDKAIDNAIMDTLKEMSEKGLNDEIYGMSEDLIQVVQLLEQDEQAKDLFVTNMRQAIGNEPIDKLKKVLKERNKTESNRSKLKRTLKLATRTASIGGNLIENTMSNLVISIFKDNENFKVYGGALTGEQFRTDNLLIFSTNVEVDTERIFREFNEGFSKTGFNLDFLDGYDRIKEFYLDHEDEMEQAFLIYTNSKNYSVGADSHNFTQEASQTLEELPKFLQQSGFNIGKTQEFLNMIYNTAQGAVFSDYREEIQESLSKMLAAGAARLMFDDYQTLGQENNNAIHMYLLDGVYIPVSIIYKSMKQAKEEMASVESSIIMPDSINDVYDPDKKGFGYISEADYKSATSKDAAIKTAIWQHWEDEKKRIRATGSWNISFTLKIKKIILSFIK